MCWTKSRLISDTGTVCIWGPADFSYEAFVILNMMSQYFYASLFLDPLKHKLKCVKRKTSLVHKHCDSLLFLLELNI